MKFQLAKIFSDGMIIQQNQTIRLYGKAVEDLSLCVDFDGVLGEYPVKKGAFVIELPPHKAGTGLVMQISCDGQFQKIQDIACGEVWIAGGQSNMAMSLSGTMEYAQDSDISPCDNIRFYTVARNSLSGPKEYGEGYEWAYGQDSGWLPCNAISAPHFSAVGYHFARKLHTTLQVPVGIISCNVGGSNMFSWLSQAAILGNPKIAPFAVMPSDGRPDEELLSEYQNYLKGWVEGLETISNIAGTEGEQPCIYYEWNNRYSYKRSSCLYDNMLSKVSRYAVRGILWYQGESEAMDGHADVYQTTLHTLYQMLCREQQQERLPFLMVQLAPWTADNVQGWENVCNAQRQFSLDVSECGMVTIGDCGGGEDIHPPRKQPVGERLAAAALCREYGIWGEYSGPIAVSAQQYNDIILVRFTHGHGLHMKRETGRFQIRYTDGLTEQVSAEIAGDCIYLSCDASRKAAFAEYEYRIDASIDLFNDSGLPASLFQLEVKGMSENDK